MDKNAKPTDRMVHLRLNISDTLLLKVAVNNMLIRELDPDFKERFDIIKNKLDRVLDKG